MNRFMKFASLLMAAVMLISCGGDEGGSLSGVLKVEVDRNLIQADGEDYTTLSVTLDGVAVTSDVEFYEGDDLLNVEDFKYFSTVAGDHEIWASYQTYVSDPVLVRVINVPIPETPADPAPERTDFKPRVMAMHFTGAGCSYCGAMMDALAAAYADEEFCDKVVKVSIHNYPYTAGFEDPAYLAWDWATAMLKVANLNDPKLTSGVTNPSIMLDYTYGYYYYLSGTTSTQYMGFIQEILDSTKDDACGIAVNATLVDGQVVAKVTVKAAKAGSYRVSAMLLEDGITAKQAGSAIKVHDACVRHIDASEKIGNRLQDYGHSLGNIAAGKTADYLFVWNLEDIQKKNDPNYYWNNFVHENLRMAVFVTDVRNDAYHISNAVNVTFNEVLPYEYK